MVQLGHAVDCQGDTFGVYLVGYINPVLQQELELTMINRNPNSEAEAATAWRQNGGEVVAAACARARGRGEAVSRVAAVKVD